MLNTNNLKADSVNFFNHIGNNAPNNILTHYFYFLIKKCSFIQATARKIIYE